MNKIIKLFKNPLVTFLLGMMIFGSIGVAYGAQVTVASNYVTYDKTSSSANGATKNNVKDALDELYARSLYTSLSGTQSVGAGKSSTNLNGLYKLTNYKVSCGTNTCAACNSCCSAASATVLKNEFFSLATEATNTITFSDSGYSKYIVYVKVRTLDPSLGIWGSVTLDGTTLVSYRCGDNSNSSCFPESSTHYYNQYNSGNTNHSLYFTHHSGYKQDAGWWVLVLGIK